jgi:hypothetical protein
MQIRRYVLVGALSAGLLAVAPTAAFATVSPTTGHKAGPVNTCGPSNPVTPGNASAARGSPFNPSGIAGLHYAGNPGTASLAHSNSTAPTAQYDNACIHNTIRASR